MSAFHNSKTRYLNASEYDTCVKHFDSLQDLLVHIPLRFCPVHLDGLTPQEETSC